jgi:signal transduction histidine kinase
MRGFTAEGQALVELLAPHAGLAIKNVRLYEQSRELSVVQERNRLARELHDSVTQTLFSMKLAAESANVLIEDDPDEARAQLARLQELARQASTEMRSLVFELRPPELEIEGLVATLRKHIDVLRRVHPIDIELHDRGERPLDPTQEKEVFRILQEALNNAIRHSGASEITVELIMEEDKLHVSVTDDGAGFDPAAPRQSRRLGLISMSERAQVLGADFSIWSAPGQGTVVALELRS